MECCFLFLAWPSIRTLVAPLPHVMHKMADDRVSAEARAGVSALASIPSSVEVACAEQLLVRGFDYFEAETRSDPQTTVDLEVLWYRSAMDLRAVWSGR